MTNLIATDAQSQEITSGLVDLFELGLPDGSTLYFHAGLNDSLDEIQFRDKKAPTNPISAGNFIVGQTYTIVSGTGFTSIGKPPTQSENTLLCL
jgi:phage-related protein